MAQVCVQISERLNKLDICLSWASVL